MERERGRMKKIDNGGRKKRVLVIGVIFLAYFLSAQKVLAEQRMSGTGDSLNDPTIDSSGVTTWDTVYFGRYWQSDTNGDGRADQNDDKEPIRWRVLSVEGEDAFLLADQNLECREYNHTSDEVTWETCTLRSWLNGYGRASNICGEDFTSENFINCAFHASEQAAIRNTKIVNEDNPKYKTEGGNDTTDKVFLLSMDEVKNLSYGFCPEKDESECREAKNTEYVKSQGAYTNTSREYAGNGYWWLRTPGQDNKNASRVGYGGYVPENGFFVSNIQNTVRPALHIDLSSVRDWTYAGTVTTVGEYMGEVTPEPTREPMPEPEPAVTSKPVQSVIISIPQQKLISSDQVQVTAMPSVQKPVQVTGLHLKMKRTVLYAKWKKNSSADGYELWYGTSKKWKDKKVKTIKKTTFTIRKIKQKKKYYIRVRAYTVQGGKRIYGKWSKTAVKKS